MQTLIQELRALPEVEYVERVPLYVTFRSPNDLEFIKNNQYALQRTKAVDAFSVHTGTARTLLAIVDDAVLISHPDLAGNVDVARSYDVADNDSDPSPPSSGPNKAGPSNFSHGTHCAGIAGAVTDNGTGVAAISNNKVSIMGIKCTRDNAPTSRVIEYSLDGIVYAINQGARVISMSFGGSGYSKTMQNLINEATANGVVFVAAAGNDNSENKIYPAAYTNVIAVASSDANDLKSNFSNYGTWIDISAPGTGILSTVTDSDGASGSYNFFSGTSMACPMVASQIALMLSENPDLTPQGVVQILKATADPIDEVPNQSPSLAGKLGSGRINALRAIQAIRDIKGTVVAPSAITNLQIVRAGQTEIEIEWTAPDAGGQAASLYEIRYSKEPITAANFETSLISRQNIFPDQPGRTQKLVLKELVPNTTYYVAIISKSLYGDSSPLSNVVSLATLPSPIIQVNPTFYNLTLDRANSSTISKNFTVTNLGTAQLNYAAALMPVAGSNISAYDKQQLTAENAVGLGGEGFITATKFTAGGLGFLLTHVQNLLNSRTSTGNLPIEVRILKGGTNPSKATLVASETFNRSVPAGGRFFTFPLLAPQRFAPGEVFWIVFVLPNGLDYPQGFDSVGSIPGTFFLSTNNGSTYEDAQTLANFLTNAAFKVRAVNADWINLNPQSGSLQVAQATDVNLGFNVTDVPDGVYQMNISFASNDPVNPVLDRPVSLKVTGGKAKFSTEPEEVNFGTLFIGGSHTVRFVLTNTGTANLIVKAESVNLDGFAAEDFTVDRESTITLAPGTKREIPVKFSPSKTGTLNGNMLMSTNDPAFGNVTIPLIANVVQPPVAAVSPSVLNFEMDTNGPATASDIIKIENKGEADLSYTVQALLDPISRISYDADRSADNHLGFGSQNPNIYTALRFDVTDASFNLTHIQNYLRTEVAANRNVTMRIFKGGNSPTSGTLLLEQSFEIATANGSLTTIPLQQSQQFKQGEVFWVVFFYQNIGQPQGYHINTPNAGRNFYSANGTNWTPLENAGGILTTSTFVIKALEMPNWLTVAPEIGQLSARNSLQHAVTVTTAGLQKGRYKGRIQVLSNDPNQKSAIVEVNLQLEDSPLADFTSNLTEVIPGEEVTFINSSQNADAYEWEFEGAEPASSTQTSPTAVYNTPGKYKVSLKAKNTRTGRTSEALVKEQYITVQNTLCHDLNAPFKGTESLAISSEGYLTGNNKQGDKAIANHYEVNRKEAYVTGVKVKFGAAVATNPEAAVTVAIWSTVSSNGTPQNILASKQVRIIDIAADLSTGRITNVVFDAPVKLEGGFFAGVILNNEPGNFVAIVHNANNDTTPGIIWTQDSSNNWKPLGAAWPDMANSALFVQPSVTQTLMPLVANFTIGAEKVCVGQQVQFDAAATIGALRYEWVLEGAATTTSSEISPKVAYTKAGTYKVILKAYDDCSGVYTVTKEISIEALPDASIAASGSTTLCEGDKVTLSAVAGEGFTYLWSTGATTRTIEVGAGGSYRVTVTNASGCTATSEVVQVIVNPLPIALITADGATIFCEGEKVTLSAPAAEGNAFLWSNGATTRSIEVNTAGNYTVTVTNANGCAVTSEATTVKVNTLPVATIAVNGATTFCQGNSVVLIASEGSNYLWSNGATSRSIEVRTAGDYTVTVTNAAGCQVTSAPLKVQVNDLPVATISASGTTRFCAGESVTLTATEGSSYRWSTGATTRQIVVRASDDYSVTVFNALGCSAISDPVKLIVHPLPIPTIRITGSTTLCQGQRVTLVAPEGSGYQYRWSNGDTTRSIEVGDAGNYSITVTNENGCAATSNAVEVNVNALPEARIIASGATTFCQGSSVVLTASEGTAYHWSNGATTRSITVSESGKYTVSVTNSNGCTAISEEERTVMNPLPDRPSIERDDIILSSSATAGNQWFRNNKAIQGATGMNYEPTESGTYHVQETSLTGCISEKSQEVYVTENDLITDLQVYPNPSTGKFTLSFTGLRPDNVNIRVVDMVGKVVFEGRKEVLESREFQLDFSRKAVGVYMLQIHHNGRNYSRKLVVQH
ncbi:S8 family serine peptidase [Rufibacter tibetensis]|uniref:S8 family serine peptidase n=1 Tax=Rufibacter tibetensis TaxID=512763 RepID=UPI0014705509|nr:S8 family serine peptidase [Rufibacter tibetensis]